MKKKIDIMLALRLVFTGACILICSVVNPVKGQVIIRDSVSISSMMDTTNGIGSQSATKGLNREGSLEKINLAGHGKKKTEVIIIPTGSYSVTITVIGGNAAACDNLVLRSPTYEVIVACANNSIGSTWTSPVYLAGTTLDIGLYWIYYSSTGSEYGYTATWTDDSTCILGFEDTGTPPWDVDVIVRVVIHEVPSGPNLNFPTYSQGDPLWAGITYDHYLKGYDKDGNPIYYNIQNKGCALCEMAWILSAYGYEITPAELNDWMNDPNSLDPYKGSSVNWNAIEPLSHGTLNVAETGTDDFGNSDDANDVSVLDPYLNNGDLVIAEVDDGGSAHWVVVEPKKDGKYPIVDAGYGDRTTMDEYYDNNIWEYVVISSNAK
ncbi:MAG: hypothetical protein ACLP05_05705 [Candidatus Kryptoniota bacterium]